MIPALTLASSNLPNFHAHNGEVVADSSLRPLDPFLSSAHMENNHRPSAENAKEYLEGMPKSRANI